MDKKLIQLSAFIAGLIITVAALAAMPSGTYFLVKQSITPTKTCPSPINSGIDFSKKEDYPAVSLVYNADTRQLQMVSKGTVLGLILTSEGTGHQETIVDRPTVKGKISVAVTTQMTTKAFEVSALSELKTGENSQSCNNTALFKLQ